MLDAFDGAVEGKVYSGTHVINAKTTYTASRFSRPLARNRIRPAEVGRLGLVSAALDGGNHSVWTHTHPNPKDAEFKVPVGLQCQHIPGRNHWMEICDHVVRV